MPWAAIARALSAFSLEGPVVIRTRRRMASPQLSHNTLPVPKGPLHRSHFIAYFLGRKFPGLSS